MPPHRRKNPADYVYHATFLGRLESILEHGLIPGGESQYGGGYTGHSRGKVFVTEFDGVGYWMNKLENIAHGESDFHEEQDVYDWSPVALRIYGGMEDYREDKLGTRDSGYEAGWTDKTLDAEAIDVWDGTAWVALEDARLDRMERAALKAATFESDGLDEDDGETEESGWFEIDYDLFVPRSP